jgi:hypothetical protein
MEDQDKGDAYYNDALERIVEAYRKRGDPDADLGTLVLLAALHVSKMAKTLMLSRAGLPADAEINAAVLRQ